MRVKIRDLTFRRDAQQKIANANVIIEEYQSAGYTITLRQLFYQFVSRDLIANTPREYANLGTTIARARLAGLVDWSAIIDRTRNIREPAHWDDPNAVVKAAWQGYQEDLWYPQTNRVEVWIEKDALTGVVMDTCERLRVPLFSCRGYVSSSEMWAAAIRIVNRYRLQGGNATFRQYTTILHMGDHDPSGLDMTRVIETQLAEFCRHYDAPPPTVKRIALNMDQIQQYDPPPNTAKQADPRFEDYQAEYGDQSWELDALPPDVLNALVESSVEPWIDRARWQRSVTDEADSKATLGLAYTHWDQVDAFVHGQV